MEAEAGDAHVVQRILLLRVEPSIPKDAGHQGRRVRQRRLRLHNRYMTVTFAAYDVTYDSAACPTRSTQHPHNIFDKSTIKRGDASTTITTVTT